MQNKYIFLILFSTLTTLLSAQSFDVEGGANIVCEGGVFIVLEDMSFDNSGHLEADYSLFKFNGTAFTAPSEIKGSALSIFRDLVVSTDISLHNYVDVEGFLQMGTGILNLNDNVLTLPTEGYGIVGETENSRVTGTIGGYLELNRNFGVLNQENPANIGIELTTNATLGSTNIQRGHELLTLPSSVSSSRWFKIEPANNNGLNATLKFHYFDNELNTLNEDLLTIWKSDNNGASWYPLEYSDRDMNLNWIEVQNQNSLSMYTLAYKSGSALAADVQNDTPIAVAPIDKTVVKVNSISTFIAWPNPVTTEINMQIEVETAIFTHLECSTLDGKLVSSEEVNLEKGINQLSRNIADLPVGIYLFNYKSTGTTPIKIVKH